MCSGRPPGCVSTCLSNLKQHLSLKPRPGFPAVGKVSELSSPRTVWFSSSPSVTRFLIPRGCAVASCSVWNFRSDPCRGHQTFFDSVHLHEFCLRFLSQPSSLLTPHLCSSILGLFIGHFPKQALPYSSCCLPFYDHFHTCVRTARAASAFPPSPSSLQLPTETAGGPWSAMTSLLSSPASALWSAPNPALFFLCSLHLTLTVG